MSIDYVRSQGTSEIEWVSGMDYKFPSSWAGRTYTKTIDTSNAKLLFWGRLYILATSSQTISLKFVSNTGDTLYQIPSQTLSSGTKTVDHQVFDVSGYDSVTYTITANYDASFSYYNSVGLVK